MHKVDDEIGGKQLPQQQGAHGTEPQLVIQFTGTMINYVYILAFVLRLSCKSAC